MNKVLGAKQHVPSDPTTDEVVRKRRTPTERQIEVLPALSDDDLLERAVHAMHALNRRAKYDRERAWMASRWRRGSYRAQAMRLDALERCDKIYQIKNEFLLEVVKAKRHETIETFTYRPEHDCDEERWFVVGVRGCRFHQPGRSAPAAWTRTANVVPSHVPDQPAREIPKVNLTIGAQLACVQMWIERMRRARADRQARRKGGRR